MRLLLGAAAWVFSCGFTGDGASARGGSSVSPGTVEGILLRVDGFGKVGNSEDDGGPFDSGTGMGF